MGLELILAAASTAVSAGAGIMQGAAANAAGQAERRQYEVQAQQKRTAANQEETIRRNELEASLGAINALRAARGLQLDSPTGRAIVGQTRENSLRDTRIARVNALADADASRRAGIMAGRAGSNSLLGGIVQGGGSLLSGGLEMKRRNLI